jgi:tetratricopeptide (TPR) repeat protein
MRRARSLRRIAPPGILPAAVAVLLSASAGPRTAAAEGAGSAPVEASRQARDLFDEGLRLERAGDGAGARAAYARALDADPGCGPAARNVVRLALRRGALDDAEREARARVARAPDAVGVRNALADALLAAGKLDLAEEESRRALKGDERNVGAMVNLATVYERTKRYELAKMVLENARQVDEADATVWNRLGFVELALGDRIQALEAFKTAAALRPDYPEAHANHGALLADAEDFGAAVAELELAVRYAPDHAPTWLNLGNAHRGAKEFEKAEAAYRRALELDPALVDTKYDLAVLYLDADKPGTPALARLEQAVAFLDAYEASGGREPRVAAYRKDAARAIEREKKRLAREERDRVRGEAEARKKDEEPRAKVPAAADTAPAKLGEERDDR